jgi:hypothetical protein
MFVIRQASHATTPPEPLFSNPMSNKESRKVGKEDEILIPAFLLSLFACMTARRVAPGGEPGCVSALILVAAKR